MSRFLRYVVPIGGLFAVVLWLGNACYLYLSVSFIQMLKAAMPICVFLTGVAMGTTKYSHATALNMVVVAIGVAIASLGEIDFVLVGVVLQVIAIACESLRITLVQVRFCGVPPVCVHLMALQADCSLPHAYAACLTTYSRARATQRAARARRC